jgi:hypothetical protein
MPTYTAFCQGVGGSGTIWIDMVVAPSVELAIPLAKGACAADWDCPPDDVHCLGIAEGNVNILHWEDQYAE